MNMSEFFFYKNMTEVPHTIFDTGRQSENLLRVWGANGNYPHAGTAQTVVGSMGLHMASYKDSYV